MKTLIQSKTTNLSFVLGGISSKDQNKELKSPANLLQIFIGKTAREQEENLQYIKDAIAHTLMLCNNDDIILGEKEKIYLQHIYEAADQQLDQMQYGDEQEEVA